MLSIRSPRSGLRLGLVAVAALGLTTSACVHPKDPGVGVTALQSDVVFGVEEAAKEAVPPVFDVPDQSSLTAERAAQDIAIPEFSSAEATVAAPKVRVPKTVVRRECADAALNAFPEKITSANLPAGTVPSLGQYRWKKKGQVQYTSLPVAVAINGFEKRRLENYVQVSPPNTGGTKSNTNPDGYRTAFTYDLVQPKLDGQGATKTTFKVSTSGGSITAPNGTTVYPPGGELSVSNPVTGNTVAYRDPEAGVSLKKIQTFDAKGNPEGSFAPPVGLLILPLGVRQGERFQSAAVDPATGQTAQLTGEIKDKARVDACGTILEGWGVESTFTMAGADGQVSRPWNYIVSTNLGGILIAEDTQFVNTEGTFQLSYSIGQVAPDPTP
jgi:hypothetical protein